MMNEGQPQKGTKVAKKEANNHSFRPRNRLFSFLRLLCLFAANL
jgi:hypothetical protein